MRKILSVILIILVVLSSSIALAGNTAASKGEGSDNEHKRLIADTTSQIDKIGFKVKGCEIIHELNDATAIKCPKGVSIENAFEDEIYTIMDIDADKQINADDVWTLGYNGSGITVAVLDTGIDTDHPEVADSIAGGKGFGYTTYEDDHGHGTHVSGIITANGEVSQAKGVAPDAKIWMAKVCNASGLCYVSDIAAAIEYVVKGPNGIVNDGDEPAKIMSISLGGGGTSLANCDTDFLAKEVNWAVDNGVTVAVAAGNTAGIVSSPACASKAIAVGAVDKSDVRASFSGTGPAIDMMAPGVSIYSSVIGVYASWSGTSMATPHVSATIALLRQVNSALTDTQIKDALYKTAKDLGTAGWDKYYGWGRVDALAAVNYILPKPPALSVSVLAPSSVTVGDMFNVSATISNTGDETATGVNATISLPTGLNPTEPLTKSVGDIAGKSSSSVSWTVKADAEGTYTITVDASDSTKTYSANGSATVSVKAPGAVLAMHIANIDMALVKNPIYTYAKATVTIVGAKSNPVEGATVYGQWNEATTDSDSGVTDVSGKVTLSSNKVRRPAAGTNFTFCVTNVTKTDWTYDNQANAMTCNSIIV